MRYLTASWYFALSLLARLALLFSVPLAWAGVYEPAVWSGWWVLYFDEQAADAWDGKA